MYLSEVLLLITNDFKIIGTKNLFKILQKPDQWKVLSTDGIIRVLEAPYHSQC